MKEQGAAWRVALDPLSRLRRLGQRVEKDLRASYWFPHVPLALGVAAAGLLLMGGKLGPGWRNLFVDFPNRLLKFPPSSMPFLAIGLGLLLMSIGLVLRSRVAWIVTIVLTTAMLAFLVVLSRGVRPVLISYDGILLVLLFIAQRAFRRSSLAAATLFAITSSLMLLVYAVFGSLYLGSEFSPPIRNFVSALYYSVETMTTLGMGDIVPKSPHARLFTISIVILGISVFATSISAIVGPMVTRRISEIIQGRGTGMKRSNHFIIVGATPLAFNTYRELRKRNLPVTLILAQAPAESGFDDADIVVGDANDLAVLGKAGAEEAQAVLAMRADDSENAFIALAVKELKGKAKTIVAVNDSKHFERVRLAQPDFIIAPQVLGGEMLAMVLSGEPITSEFVTEHFLHANPQNSSEPPPS